VIHDGSDEVLTAFPDASGQCADVKYDAEDCKTGNVYGQMKPGARRLDKGSAARFFYVAKASKEDRNEGCEQMGGNNHVTVKPTELMRYLCRLVTPPGGTVLDPFTGSGSTGKAAVYEGFNFIGIEQSVEYVAIAEARIAFAVDEVKIATAQQELFA